ncbi:MAG: PASTA domain-containing protein [Treponema sp.]|jgi:beta-lactam-binding protein with PASTA domain|nr:PASTA domain-containing protein [Treponema sp.]
METEILPEQNSDSPGTIVLGKKIQKYFKRFRFEQYQGGGKRFLLTLLGSVFLMAVVAVAVFFAFVSRPEQVLVPDVTGKVLTTALLEMQVKELYPKIQLRYSNSPDDKGLILEQNPSPGSIVKAGRRITLVVSQGIIIDTVGNFTGRQYAEVQMELQTLFSGTIRPLIALAEPVYTPDAAAPGIVLAQDPAAGTPITEPVTVKLMVSRGLQTEQAAVPNLVGMTVSEVFAQMERSKVIFDFSAQYAGEGEKTGTVIAQESSQANVPNYARIQARFALPEKAVNGNIYGIFSAEITAFPYAVPVQMAVRPPSGRVYTAVLFEHTGGHITVPYAAPAGSELTLVAGGRTVATKIAN